MTILRTQIFGSSLIGVYLAANSRYVLYPSNLIPSKLSEIKRVFQGSDFYPLTINNSNLLGVYTVSNKSGIIVPSIIKDDEMEVLKSHLKDDYQIEIVESIDNAFGNLILCNDHVAVISSLLKNYKKQIEDALEVESIVYDFGDINLPGSISIANNMGCLVHPLSTDDQIEYLSSFMKIEVDVSTINRGIPYLSSGAIVNDKHGIFGSDSTGPELMRLTNVLKI